MAKETIPYKSIADELIQMAARDQTMRIQAQSNGAKWDPDIDRTNVARLKEMLLVIDWPVISKVGQAASNAAWLIAQHADEDPVFQQQCLDKMQSSKQGDVLPANVAYLEDRVRINTGLPQLYGTQFYREGEVLKPHPIQDEENIEQRRIRVGLEPYSLYREEMIKLYG